MFSKPTPKKTNKIDSKSKKLFKSRKPSAKKSRHIKSPMFVKKMQQKHSLAYYLSEQCMNTLTPFINLPIFPKPLQLNYQDGNQVISAFNSFKSTELPEAFDEKIDKMRYLTSSQEGLIEHFLQDKYTFSKSSANLQEIYCYSTAKNLLQSQFQEFFLKRNEFLSRLQGIEGFEANITENNAVDIKHETFNENSFSTTNVSSPTINSPYGQSGFQMNNGSNYQENFFNCLINNAKMSPEMMANLLNNEHENNNA